MSVKNLFLSDKSKLRKYGKLANKVMDKTQEYLKQDIKDYPKFTNQLKQELQDGKTTDDILVDAYGLVGAAATKVLGMTPYKVQIIGGIILNHNMIAEMHTGEGKTLTATQPLYLNALSGKGAHLVTANPYLAKRDAKELEPLYNALGLTVGINHEEIDDPEKVKKAYQADITYTTGSALGFDYLNDNLAQNKNERRQRGFNYVLLDEADSILLDNANTPLIISGKGRKLTVEYQQANAFVRGLDKKSVIVEKEKKAVRLKPSGVAAAKAWYGNDLFENQRANVHYLMNALQAHFLYQNGKDYLTRISPKEGVKTVELVDLNTGRVLDGQRFSEGIHQALEAKENVMIHTPNMTSATITYQSLFQKYNKVAGMTGTAMTDKEELDAVYGLDVLAVPTNKPDQRTDYPDKIYANQKEKYLAVAQEIVKYVSKQQPVLIGTTSVKDSMILSQLLDNYGIQHNTLNANNPQKEAKIVAKAGRKGAVTVATNMAGRGTDIKLDKGVEKQGGLVVLGTDRAKSPRVDNQLRGRTARQGQKGITQFFVSLEDDLFNNYRPNILKKLLKQYKGYKGEIHDKRIERLFNNAQKELANESFENRKSDLTYESIIADEREAIYKQRDAILDDTLDYHQVMEKLVNDTIGIYFDSLKNEVSPVTKEIKVTRRLINRIQKELINDQFTNTLMMLGSKYKSLTEIESRIRFATKQEMEARFKLFGKNISDFLRPIMLKSLDYYWSKEISYLNDLKRMITLEGYRQANPYVEYQREASNSYQEMLQNIRASIVELFYKTTIQIVPMPQQMAQENQLSEETNGEEVALNSTDSSNESLNEGENHE